MIEGVDAFYKGATEQWARLPIMAAVSMEAQRRSGIPLEKLAAYYSQFLKMAEELDKAQRQKQ